MSDSNKTVVDLRKRKVDTPELETANVGELKSAVNTLMKQLKDTADRVIELESVISQQSIMLKNYQTMFDDVLESSRIAHSRVKQDYDSEHVADVLEQFFGNIEKSLTCDDLRFVDVN